MFGPKLTTVFANRWRALWFSASMLLLAYCTVPGGDDASPPASVSEATAAVAAQAESSDLTKEQKAQISGIMDGLNQIEGKPGN
jgi:hypothetical protein